MEIDIYDIPVAEITEQYMAYIHAMQEIELNIASEYLVMAATLIAMKSATLLPTQVMDDHDEEYEEDPREQLIARLVEYRKYKEAATTLKEKELEENQIYTRHPFSFSENMEKVPVTRGELSIFTMIDAMENILKRKSWNQPLETTIDKMEISIDERMNEVMDLIKEKKSIISFDQLFPYPNKTHIVTTFLAVLQLLKDGKIFCEQDGTFAPIFIGAKVHHTYV